jgi:DNA-directed RNA polymerase specialized sigma24 family protein
MRGRGQCFSIDGAGNQGRSKSSNRFHKDKRIRKMTMPTIDVLIAPLKSDQPESRDQGQLEQFVNWFSRCRNTLHYVAELILKDSEMAEHAVQNCRQKASRNLPGFEREGEFRGWIVRVLIDEALIISTARY